MITRGIHKLSDDIQYSTRDGRKVRVLCFDRPDPEFPIVGLIGNGIFAWQINGKAPGSFGDKWDLLEVASTEEYESDGPAAA